MNLDKYILEVMEELFLINLAENQIQQEPTWLEDLECFEY